MLGRQQVEQVILRHVGVLVLIHHDVTQAVLVALANGFLLAQHACGEHQQVVEIDGVVLAQAFFISLVHTGHGGIETVVLRLALKGFDVHEVILQRTDAAADLLRGVEILGDFQVAHALFDKGKLIGGVVDDEIGRQANVFGLSTQHTGAGGVEGAEP